MVLVEQPVEKASQITEPASGRQQGVAVKLGWVVCNAEGGTEVYVYGRVSLPCWVPALAGWLGASRFPAAAAFPPRASGCA